MTTRNWGLGDKRRPPKQMGFHFKVVMVALGLMGLVIGMWLYRYSQGYRQVDHSDILIRVGIHRNVQYYIDERHQICFATGDVGFTQIDDLGCGRLLYTYGAP